MMNISHGTADWNLLKSMSEETLKEAGVSLEELEKAMNREGLVQRDVQVTRNGKTHTRKQWVRAGDVKGKKPNMAKVAAKYSDKNRLNKLKNGESVLVTSQKKAFSLQRKAKEQGINVKLYADKTGLVRLSPEV